MKKQIVSKKLPLVREQVRVLMAELARAIGGRPGCSEDNSTCSGPTRVSGGFC